MERNVRSIGCLHRRAIEVEFMLKSGRRQARQNRRIIRRAGGIAPPARPLRREGGSQPRCQPTPLGAKHGTAQGARGGGGKRTTEPGGHREGRGHEAGRGPNLPGQAEDRFEPHRNRFRIQLILVRATAAPEIARSNVAASTRMSSRKPLISARMLSCWRARKSRSTSVME
jgi:hypothetical protein